jgi:hypothetical protein
MKHELQNIISGKSQVRHGDAIQAIARYLRGSKSTSKKIKQSQQIKSEEATCIKEFCDQNNFWKTDIDLTSFVSSGAEQKVYLQDNYQVFKLNDAIYYESWEDYLNNLLLNNYFFQFCMRLLFRNLLDPIKTQCSKMSKSFFLKMVFSIRKTMIIIIRNLVLF